MKRLLACILISASLGASAMSRSDADSLTAKSQRSYAAGEYEAALAALDSVAASYNSAALQLNIGNCWFKLGDVAHAILHYERGLRLAPGDADLQANLDLANEQVKDRIAGKPAFALGSTWGRLRGGHDPDQWARRSLWACALFFTLLTIAIIVRPRILRRVAWGLTAVVFLGLITSIAFASARNAEIHDDSEAIIVAPKVDVLGEPRVGSKVLFVLHKGTKLVVLNEADGWYEVQLPNSNVGWMPPGTIERI